MCHFITALLPASMDLKGVETVFERHKIGFQQIHNPNISAQAEPGAIYIQTTRNVCDCGTPLGSLAENGNNDSLSFETQIAKFRKQGWSEAKIQRWREEKALIPQKQQREREAKSETATEHVGGWVTFLTDLLRLGHTDRIGILLHWYRGSVSNERIKIERQEFVPLADLNADQLLTIEEDVIYQYIS